jgi:indolepyruvate ferredoxin oxidoreductase
VTIDPAAVPLAERLDFLAADLVAYHDRALADDFRARIGRLAAAEAAARPSSTALTRAAMETLYKVTAIKDEYEVARHHTDPAFRARLDATFEDVRQVRIVLAPPILARPDPATGRPKKSSFGPWILPMLGIFAKFRRVRGMWFDPFGHSAERKAERAMRDGFRADVERMIAELARDGAQARFEALLELAVCLRDAKGFGPIKDAAMERVGVARAAILARLDRADAVTARAAE